MRRIVNIAALMIFVWLVLDAFHIPNALLYFLLAGELPILNISLPANLMLAIMMTSAVIVVAEVMTRKIPALRALRKAALGRLVRTIRLATTARRDVFQP